MVCNHVNKLILVIMYKLSTKSLVSTVLGTISNESKL